MKLLHNRPQKGYDSEVWWQCPTGWWGNDMSWAWVLCFKSLCSFPMCEYVHQWDRPCPTKRKWGWSIQSAHNSTKGEAHFPFLWHGRTHKPFPQDTQTHTDTSNTLIIRLCLKRYASLSCILRPLMPMPLSLLFSVLHIYEAKQRKQSKDMSPKSGWNFNFEWTIWAPVKSFTHNLYRALWQVFLETK